MPSGCARAFSAAGASWSQGKSGSPDRTPTRRVRRVESVTPAVLRRQGRDQRVVLVDHTHLGGAAGRAEVVEEVDVGVVVVLPLLRGVVLVEDRLDRAHRLAGAAVDALVGVDVEHPLALVDAVDGALVDARAVLQVHTGLGDDVGHLVPPEVRSGAGRGQPSIPPRPLKTPPEDRHGSPLPRGRPRAARRRPAGRRTPGAAGRDRTDGRPGDDRRARHLRVVGGRRATVRREDGNVVEIAAPTSSPASPCRPGRRCTAARRREADRLALPGLAGGRERAARRLAAARRGRVHLRANSVLALGDPGMPAAEAVARVSEWYAARSLPARAHVHPARPEAAAFAEAGWSIYEPTLLLLASVAKVLRNLGPQQVAEPRHEAVRRRRLAGQRRAGGEVRRRARAVLEAGRSPSSPSGTSRCGARPRSRRVPRRLGRVSALWTDPAHRGTGLGSAVLESVLSGGPSVVRPRRTSRWSSPTSTPDGSTRRAGSRCTTATPTSSCRRASGLGRLLERRGGAGPEEHVVRRAAMSPPTTGKMRNTQSCRIASHPANRAGPKERAGFTLVLSIRMLIRWIRVRLRPIASGAKPFGARVSVTPRMM